MLQPGPSMVGIHNAIDLNGIGPAAIFACRARAKVVGFAGLDIEFNNVQVGSLTSPTAHGLQAAWIDNGGPDPEGVVPRLNPKRVARHNFTPVDGDHGHGMNIAFLLADHAENGGRIRAGPGKGRSGRNQARQQQQAGGGTNPDDVSCFLVHGGSISFMSKALDCASFAQFLAERQAAAGLVQGLSGWALLLPGLGVRGINHQEKLLALPDQPQLGAGALLNGLQPGAQVFHLGGQRIVAQFQLPVFLLLLLNQLTKQPDLTVLLPQLHLKNHQQNNEHNQYETHALFSYQHAFNHAAIQGRQQAQRIDGDAFIHLVNGGVDRPQLNHRDAQRPEEAPVGGAASRIRLWNSGQNLYAGLFNDFRQFAGGRPKRRAGNIPVQRPRSGVMS